MADKPNILLILSDQHAAKWCGACGHPIVQTPHMSALPTGMRFRVEVQFAGVRPEDCRLHAVYIRQREG